MIRRLLIANRGEIACRIIQTAQRMGVFTIAVFSEADRGARHVELADTAVFIGPSGANESYLSADAVLSAAARTDADAIHPGYGFLSENAGFARSVVERGLTWVGPPASAIEAMGDKARSKVLMREAGVPCVPGFDGDDPTDSELIAAGEQVGVPLLVKASAGGGGRGMRRVNALDELPDALRSARAEAEAAFGSSALLLERLVDGARHVEVQVMADASGAIIHLGERDCSVQRRHQKVIEEAPSPAVDEALRSSLGAAACAAAAAVHYSGAGTVEFLLAPDGAFYFLEMNTRLQVEHPVTEAVTGLDLVEMQIRVAQGEPLALSQSDIRLAGHAIEARLYAEDPSTGYLPQTGRILRWTAPTGDGVRVDHGMHPEQTVSPYYDPMVAKVIASGPDRDTARRRLVRALNRSVLLGLRSNRGLLDRILESDDFVANRITTSFLDDRPELAERVPLSLNAQCLAAALVVERFGGDGFRSAHPLDQPIDLEIDGDRTTVRLTRGAGPLLFGVDGHSSVVRLGADAPTRRAEMFGERVPFAAAWAGSTLYLSVGPQQHVVTLWAPQSAGASDATGTEVVAPMAGTVVRVLVERGDRVCVGDPVCSIEAMKIESTLRANVDGTVCEVRCAPGEAVSAAAILIRIDPQEPS